MFPSVGMRVGFVEAVMGAVQQEISRQPETQCWSSWRMVGKQLATAWTESPMRGGPVLGIKPPTSQLPFSAWCQSEEPRGPCGQRAGCTSCLCWKGLQTGSL